MNFDFSKNHFELFGIQSLYQIDQIQLEQAYRDIQSQIHPDKFAHLSEAERRLSMQWSTQANEAYQALRHPLGRASYLLYLNGIDIQDETNTAMSPEFLMQQMEWREAIGESRAAKDVSALEQLSSRLRAEIQSRQHQMADLLDVEKNYTRAAGIVRELKFMEKLREEINFALEALDA